jgi:hypothetical protein
MSTINSNGGSFNPQNSSNIPLDLLTEFEGIYTSLLNFSTIEVSVKCDSTYQLHIIYSPDSTNEEFVETILVDSVSLYTLFYKFEPKMRYFKIKIKNNDSINQTQLSLNCILKSSFIYSSQLGSLSDVNIISPLDNGSVKIVQAGVFQTSLIWSNELLSPNDISQPVGATYPVSNCTVYGNVSSACVLALQFAINNDSTYYTSQYQVSLTGSSDFGFAISGVCSPVMRLICLSGTPTVTAYITLA